MIKEDYNKLSQRMVVELVELNRKHLNCVTNEKSALLERYNMLRQEFSDLVTKFHGKNNCNPFSSARRYNP